MLSYYNSSSVGWVFISSELEATLSFEWDLNASVSFLVVSDNFLWEDFTLITLFFLDEGFFADELLLGLNYVFVVSILFSYVLCKEEFVSILILTVSNFFF